MPWPCWIKAISLTKLPLSILLRLRLHTLAPDTPLVTLRASEWFFTLAGYFMALILPLLLFETRVWNKVVLRVSNFAGGATAEQICLRDQAGVILESVFVFSWSSGHSGLPLLLEMSLPNTPFINALAKFKAIRFYANVRGDRSVQYCSAALAAHNPYTKLTSEELREMGADSCVLKEERVDQQPGQESQFQPGSPNWGKVGLATVGALAMSPFIACHAALVIGPMRMVSMALDPGRPKDDERIAVDLGTMSEPSCDGTEDPDLPQFEDEELPRIMRENLCKLPVIRVDCYLSDRFSHAAIVSRRSWHAEHGLKVLNHICDSMLEIQHKKE
eukprot:c19293_g1_i2.p1 GENE.c19293_g1_i2~~c19293_g1_i2.p1  ORF type:complete len:331 (+),score=59.78 c19293_g1_i2:322-1314(+)